MSLAGGIAFPSTEESGRASPRPIHASVVRVHDVQPVSRPPSPNLNYAQYTSPYSRPPTPTSPHRRSKLTEQPPPPPADFFPSDVILAHIEDDVIRLRARRKAAQQQSRRSHHGAMNAGLSSPCGSTFSVDSASTVFVGLAMGAGIRDVLPLKSRFYDWCSEYFKEPQMRVSIHSSRFD